MSLLVLYCCVVLLNPGLAQVAPPVWPTYNLTALIAEWFNFPLVNEHNSVQELLQREAVQIHDNACLINAKQPTHSTNKAIEYSNLTELRSDPTYMSKTTYWVNDYLHVGHVHYDIVQIQILKLLKVDRIIMQRPACHGTLCVGIGSVDRLYNIYKRSPPYFCLNFFYSIVFTRDIMRLCSKLSTNQISLCIFGGPGQTNTYSRYSSPLAPRTIMSMGDLIFNIFKPVCSYYNLLRPCQFIIKFPR